MTDDLITRLSVGTTEKFRDGSSETVSTALEREAAEALKAKNARIAELEAQNEFIMSANNELSWALKERDEATAHYKSLRARIAELEARLKKYDPIEILGDQRKTVSVPARVALEKK